MLLLINRVMLCYTAMSELEVENHSSEKKETNDASINAFFVPEINSFGRVFRFIFYFSLIFS